jgi:CxxC motif-containing protein (DUF1111 family)
VTKRSMSILAVLSLSLSVGVACAQSDPGPRSGAPGAGTPITGLSDAQTGFFNDGAARFNSTHGVDDGLGPTFNGDSCGLCHSQPAEGGTSPTPNPQVALATSHGATNTLPSFIYANGPVREVRFKWQLNPDGSPNRHRPDGGVHDLYTIQGRDDGGSCIMSQPNFAAAVASHNASFRIPTPVFGAGLIENISEQTILDNAAANAAAKMALGIVGFPNRSGNDGTITRFGWKAQNKSLFVFAGEAYNVEMGVSNELFPNERSNPPSSCLLNSTPEDVTGGDSNDAAGTVTSDITAFALFMRFLDQPTPAPSTPSTTNGAAKFSAVGCALCHTPSLTTNTTTVDALSGVQANLFSDLLVHSMGDGLADGVSQGAAGPEQFRTAPLWGLGQRLYFLHDGRTSDLMQAIHAHRGEDSEANRVIRNFNQLSASDQQDILTFLRSL